MRRICPSNQWGFQLVTTCDDSEVLVSCYVCSLNCEFFYLCTIVIIHLAKPRIEMQINVTDCMHY